MLLWLADTPDETYGIVPELKAEGLTHYFAVPCAFSDGQVNMNSWATASPGGFSEAHLDLLRAIEPAVASVLEIRMLRRAMVDTLQIYLGDEPGRRVADGAIVRGEVSEIEAAILFADLRGFTENAMRLDSETLVRLINEYFACLIPAVDRQRGDVLKLMGDGMLAIFSDAGGDAAQRALAAAREAQDVITDANRRGSEWPDLAAGTALHHGTAAYGNIGAPERLDFTVIGRDVNIAARICGVCRLADAPVLMSDAFRQRLGQPGTEVGTYPLHGIAAPVTVYAPD